MSDARRMNQAIMAYLKQVLQGTVTDSHICALALMITGLIRSKSSNFEQIETKSGARAKLPSRVKQIHRINELLNQGLDGEEEVTTVIFRLGVERLVQEMLEQEVTDYLGREHYQRHQAEQEHRGYRNGYEPGRFRTAEGEVVVQAPQVRDAPVSYRSRLMSFLRGNSDVPVPPAGLALERLAVEMYARGLSTRDIEDALPVPPAGLAQEATGDRLLSRTAVSQLTDVLWEEYEAFAQRDLSGFEVEYLSHRDADLFLDAVYESLPEQGGGKEGVLCAWAVCVDGCKVMLHLALGNKESYENWLDFLRDMVKRGLPEPVLVTTDGSPGLIRAVEEVFPNSLRQRCLAHETRNVTEKVPDSARAEVKAAVQAAYYAPNQEVARMMAADVLEPYQALYPSAMKSFQDDWEACIAYLCCPRVHHPCLPQGKCKRIRTTNLLERSFLEERRRTKVIPRFFTEKSCLKLVFATLWRASQRWQGVSP